jgi:hypothetical protein
MNEQNVSDLFFLNNKIIETIGRICDVFFYITPSQCDNFCRLLLSCVTWQSSQVVIGLVQLGVMVIGT